MVATSLLMTLNSQKSFHGCAFFLFALAEFMVLLGLVKAAILFHLLP